MRRPNWPMGGADTRKPVGPLDLGVPDHEAPAREAWIVSPLPATCMPPSYTSGYGNIQHLVRSTAPGTCSGG
jgi:hypothetical protein